MPPTKHPTRTAPTSASIKSKGNSCFLRASPNLTYLGIFQISEAYLLSLSVKSFYNSSIYMDILLKFLPCFFTFCKRKNVFEKLEWINIIMMMITILSNKEYPVAIFPVSKIFCSGSSSLSKAIFPPWTLHHNSLGKGPGWASPPSVCGCCSHVHLSTDLLPLVLFSSRWNNLFSPKKSLFLLLYVTFYITEKH